jgi:hypothetical protein
VSSIDPSVPPHSALSPHRLCGLAGPSPKHHTHVPTIIAKMDVAGLRDRIQATLDANAAIRQQAELDLKHVRAMWKQCAWSARLT